MKGGRSDGFTLPELLVASALMMLLVSGVAGLAMATDRLAQRQPHRMDAQQRVRVVQEALTRGLRSAGGLMPLQPRRIGRVNADPPGTARPDVFSIVTWPDTLAQTHLARAFDSTDSLLLLSGCGPGRDVCALARGQTLAVVDGHGGADLVDVRTATGNTVTVRSLAASTLAFPVGAPVVEVEAVGYYFDRELEQLRYFTASGTDQPVVDGIEDLAFEYFGTPEAPRRPRPPMGIANCLYAAEGDWRGGTMMSVSEHGLAALPLERLGDGPWCGKGATAFDADVWRIRRVRVRVLASDYQAVFDVTPPNLVASSDGVSAW